MIRNMCRWACNFLISHTRIKTRTRGNFYQLCTMFNPSSYDQPIPTHPHMIKIKHCWDVLNNRSKKRPVHQRRQMKCLLVAITILLQIFTSTFSISLSRAVAHSFSLFDILDYKAKRPAQTDVIICSNFQRMAGIRWRAIKRVLMTLFLRRSSGFFHRVRTWCVSSKLTQCQIFHHTILIRSTWMWIILVSAKHLMPL